MSEQFKAPKGLQGVSIANSKITKSDADGSLVYRGYPIREIASHAGFEETAYLILNGSLPRRSQLQAFNETLEEKMKVESKVYRLMKDLGKDPHPIGALRTAISALASIDKEPTIQG